MNLDLGHNIALVGFWYIDLNQYFEYIEKENFEYTEIAAEYESLVRKLAECKVGVLLDFEKGYFVD